LRRIFDHNQEEFTKAEPRTIPTIAVVEEAQAVLNSAASGSEPYVAWVKEGRKYDLGAVLITQQPGSIPNEILSQGDNWFVFHLLSAGDLHNVRKANAHFSEDLLSALLNEPIAAQGVFWSSVAGKPYPLPLRIFSFETTYGKHQPSYTEPAVKTFASELRERFASRLVEAAADGMTPTALRPATLPQARGDGAPFASDAPDPVPTPGGDGEPASDAEEGGWVDALKVYKERAIRALAKNVEFQRSIKSDRGIPWGRVVGLIADALPDTMGSDRQNVAYGMVEEAMTRLLGGKDEAWETVRRDTARKSGMLFIVRKAPVTS
jgi:hypothetical protein